MILENFLNVSTRVHSLLSINTRFVRPFAKIPPLLQTLWRASGARKQNRKSAVKIILLQISNNMCKSIHSCTFANPLILCCLISSEPWIGLLTIGPVTFKRLLIVFLFMYTSLSSARWFLINDSQVPVSQHFQRNKMVISNACTFLEICSGPSIVRTSFQEAAPSSLVLLLFLFRLKYLNY